MDKRNIVNDGREVDFEIVIDNYIIYLESLQSLLSKISRDIQREIEDQFDFRSKCFEVDD